MEKNVLDFMAAHRIIAVLRAPHTEGAVKAGEAMIKGGIKIIEVTTTTPGWQDATRGVSAFASVMTGAGTITAPEQVMEAKNSGAKFIVSPGFDTAVADTCLDEGLPFFPGIATPSEIMTAVKHPAVTALKFFPAGNFGGPGYIKAMKGPFPDIHFIPTGGVSVHNAREYLDAGAIAVGMSSICKKDIIEKTDWGKITADTKELLASLPPL